MAGLLIAFCVLWPAGTGDPGRDWFILVSAVMLPVLVGGAVDRIRIRP